MLLISRSMNLQKITCLSPLCSTDKMSFPTFSIFNFLLQSPVTFYVSLIIKELCSSSSCSFHFCRLTFIGIMKKSISSQNMTNQIGSVLFSPVRPRTSSLTNFSGLSPPFSSSTTFQSFPHTFDPIFLVYRSLRNVLKLHLTNFFVSS